MAGHPPASAFGRNLNEPIEQMMNRIIRQTAIPEPSTWANPNIGGGIHSGAFASSSASGNESMSVSQAGDQISIEMSSPDGGAPIRLRGTMDQVEQQMRNQALSPATRQKIRRALGQ